MVKYIVFFSMSSSNVSEYSSFILREVGKRIESYRLKAGYTQEYLAKAVGITQEQMQRYEQGEDSFAPGAFYAIAGALSVHFLSLIPSSELEGIWKGLEQRVHNYEQGKSKLTTQELYSIAKTPSVDVKGVGYEDENNANETSSSVENFDNQELRDEVNFLVNSLAEKLVDKEEIAKAEKVRIAKGLVESGIRTEIISQATGLSTGEFA